MTTPIKRSNRLRKKLYLDEYAILGFEFSCKIDLTEEADYGQFFDNLDIVYAHFLTFASK